MPSKTCHDNFSGFDEARYALWCFDSRAHVHQVLARTRFSSDDRTSFIHVDNFTYHDRILLTAFDQEGLTLGSDVVYDDDCHGLNLAPEFNCGLDDMILPVGSNLATICEDGWVINMEELRTYDLVEDRRSTQRMIVLANLRDMIGDGDARCFLFGTDLTSTETSTLTGANEGVSTES